MLVYGLIKLVLVCYLFWRAWPMQDTAITAAAMIGRILLAL